MLPNITASASVDFFDRFVFMPILSARGYGCSSAHLYTVRFHDYRHILYFSHSQNIRYIRAIQTSILGAGFDTDTLSSGTRELS